MTTAVEQRGTSVVWGGERSSSIALFVSRGAATGISFLISLYLAKALGATEYGTYSFALGVLTFIGIFFRGPGYSLVVPYLPFFNNSTNGLHFSL